MTIIDCRGVAIGLALLAVSAPVSVTTPVAVERVLAGGDGPQERVSLSPDGAAGFYAAWLDGPTILVQRLDRDAVPVWAAPRSIATGSVTGIFVVGTQRGAYVAWGMVGGGNTTRVQFVETDGRTRWATPTTLAGLAPLRVVSDGGERVAVLGTNVTGSFELHLVDKTGAMVDGASGIGTRFADSSGGPIEIHPVDLAAVAPGEIIVAWGGPTLNVRKVGGSAWGPTPVVANFGNKSPVRVVADGSGGAIIVWGDRRRSPREADVFARRVDAAGRLLGPAGGIELHRNVRPELTATTDGAGGAIAVFTAEASERGFPVPRVHAQRVTGAGAKAWASSVRLDASSDSSRLPVVTADGRGGAVVVHKTEPTGTGASIVDCLVAQRVGADGAKTFGTNGSRFGRCGAEPNGNVVVVGTDTVLVGWRDTRSGYPDVYTWRASVAGVVALAVPVGPASPAVTTPVRAKVGGALPAAGPKLPANPTFSK